MPLMSPRPRRSSVFLAVFALLLAAMPALLASNVHAASATKAKTWNVMVGAESSSGAVQTMAYGPKKIWINAGDTVHWVANSMEPHTVSFIDDKHPAVEFSPMTTYMTAPTSKGSISKPGQFRSSGIMAPAPDALFPDAVTSYDLKFKKPGKYKYLCYVHGEAMKAVVVVRKAGTPYPHTQAEYNAMATKASNADIEHGLNLWSDALGAASSHHVFMGAADMRAQVNRFIPGNIVVKVGDSVTFDMARNVFPVPHTVTFGPPPANPFAPTGDPTNFQGAALSSGVILPAGFGPPPSTFTVKFTKAGTYSYVCLIHAGMGMVGQVVVQ
ncbi:plastocyanin [Nocardioides cavernae]|uniref:Plastocyanin n=1 Tax=Nocardioides cavernae TaxID=1921566 RepID=A0ABR8NDT2_9ACTN|nr:plastocyanin/azurin family copper-binding protein [Nocardioides cavernae]MBD3926293.1 plastocyanin [Nocardioides cavernae]MBM7513886.1 plastocyanin [Nocardioides cavernae]